MSDIAGHLGRVRDAFKRPTLSLLSRTRAPIVLAILMASFSRDQEPIAAERFHIQVGAYLSELAAAGEDVPGDAPRLLCRRWVVEQWLMLSANEDHVEEYTLTSHAQEAIEYVNRLSGERSMFSQSRIRTILEAARRCAIDANPDRNDRLRRLDAQIRGLTAERNRIAAGGEISGVPDDRILEEYLNLRDLIAQLPADFLRVSEAVKAIQRVIAGEFRAKGARAGQDLDLYLERSADLMSESAEGRAFLGAVELLRDDRLLKDLRDDLNTILNHPFAEAVRSRPLRRSIHSRFAYQSVGPGPGLGSALVFRTARSFPVHRRITSRSCPPACGPQHVQARPEPPATRVRPGRTASGRRHQRTGQAVKGSGQGGIWVRGQEAVRRPGINQAVLSQPLHGTAPGCGVAELLPHGQQVRILRMKRNRAPRPGWFTTVARVWGSSASGGQAWRLRRVTGWPGCCSGTRRRRSARS